MRVNICLFNLYFYVSDCYYFKDFLSGPTQCWFRLYNQFAIFVYSQLQFLVHDRDLGTAEDWDRYLTLDLNKVTFKTPNEFMSNTDFVAAVAASRVSTPKKFIAQTMNFYLHFCNILLRHPLKNCLLLKGLSSFDSSVLLYSPPSIYTESIQFLVNELRSSGWLSTAEATLVTSQYRAFVTKLRADGVLLLADYVGFLSSFWDLQSRESLYKVFKLSCLSVQHKFEISRPAEIKLSKLGMAEERFNSLIASLQFSMGALPNINELMTSESSLSNIQDLLGQGIELFTDKTLSPWDVMCDSSGIRETICDSLKRSYERAEPERTPIVDDIVISDLSLIRPPEDVASTSSSPSSSTPSPQLSKAKLELSKVRECPDALGSVLFPGGKPGTGSPKRRKSTRGDGNA